MLQYLLLCFFSAGATFIPWLFPVALGHLFLLVEQSYDPWWILFWSTAGAMIGDTFLRYIDLYFINAINRFYRVVLKKEKRYSKEAKHDSIQKKTPTSKIGKLIKKAYMTLHKQEHSLPLFIAVAFTAHVAIPDILIISLVRTKKSYRFFMSAAFIGKFLLYASYLAGALGLFAFLR